MKNTTKISCPTQIGLAMFVLLGLADPASAGIIAFGGDTTGDPVWQRPVANGNNAPNTLFSAGTATPYEVFQFAVDTTGTYSFVSIAANSWDNYSLL